jgi:hypothetical protein
MDDINTQLFELEVAVLNLGAAIDDLMALLDDQ